MNLTEYQSLALRTAAQTGNPLLRLAVAGLGLAGETAEVLDIMTDDLPDREKLIKECGDVLWYIAEMASATGLDMADVEPRQDDIIVGDDDTTRMVVDVGMLVDYIKKVVGHGHALDKDVVRERLHTILTLLTILSHSHSFTLNEVCEKNIAKLRARYPSGFSTERSVNRVNPS